MWAAALLCGLLATAQHPSCATARVQQEDGATAPLEDVRALLQMHIRWADRHKEATNAQLSVVYQVAVGLFAGLSRREEATAQGRATLVGVPSLECPRPMELICRPCYLAEVTLLCFAAAELTPPIMRALVAADFDATNVFQQLLFKCLTDLDALFFTEKPLSWRQIALSGWPVFAVAQSISRAVGQRGPPPEADPAVLEYEGRVEQAARQLYGVSESEPRDTNGTWASTAFTVLMERGRQANSDPFSICATGYPLALLLLEELMPPAPGKPEFLEQAERLLSSCRFFRRGSVQKPGDARVSGRGRARDGHAGPPFCGARRGGGPDRGRAEVGSGGGQTKPSGHRQDGSSALPHSPGLWSNQ
mmetsp:Transcript_66404/g.151974  ORF Transcript_66404/g.151974 Transcript_66404/m.151974 type:complete len:362 (+) Transcript_66404:44-1129(+)